MNINFLHHVPTLTEFYKVSWISPFNDKYSRYVEPGITAINKLYKKIIYKKQPYLVSNKTNEKLLYLKKEYIKLTNSDFYLTNVDEYISKSKLQNIKSKSLNNLQLTTIYLYQSDFYYKYWNEQKRQITLRKKSTMQPNYIYLEFLANYEYFIQIASLDNHTIIIAFNENSYKIIIFKNDEKKKICDSIYAIKWAIKTKRNFTINDEDILKYIVKVVEDQKCYLERFYYYAADFSLPKLNKYKNFKKVSTSQSAKNICNIPSKFVDAFDYYNNDGDKYITAKNELARYIYNKSKKQPSITHYKFANNEIFEPDSKVVFYRGMNIPKKENINIFHKREFISITRNKIVAMGFMDIGLSAENSHILYEITLEKGVPYIDFKILGQNTLYFEDELLLFTTPCAFRYEEPIPTNTGVGVYYICEVSISVNELIQYKFKNIPDIKRFKELQLDDSLLSENKSSSSFNISSSSSSINSQYESLNNVPLQSTNQKLNTEYEKTNVILEHTINKERHIIYKRIDINDESVYIDINNVYYEVSGKITDENKKTINKKITYKNIADILNELFFQNKNYFVYLNKYSALCKKLKLVKFMIKETETEATRKMETIKEEMKTKKEAETEREIEARRAEEETEREIEARRAEAETEREIETRREAETTREMEARRAEAETEREIETSRAEIEATRKRAAEKRRKERAEKRKQERKKRATIIVE